MAFSRKRPSKVRRFVIRVALVLMLIALGAAMYGIGREFGVLLDNETVTIDGREYPAIEYGLLVVDGDEKNSVEIWEYDRIMQKLVGTSHTLRVQELDENDDSILKTVERKVKIDFNTRELMISLAALAQGADNILIPNPAFTGDYEIVRTGDDPDDDESTVPGF